MVSCASSQAHKHSGGRHPGRAMRGRGQGHCQLWGHRVSCPDALRLEAWTRALTLWREEDGRRRPGPGTEANDGASAGT